MMNDAVDLLILVDVELYVVDVQEVVDVASFVVDLLLLDDVSDNVDAEVEGMILDPDE